jgi:hypothetical protein
MNLRPATLLLFFFTVIGAQAQSTKVQKVNDTTGLHQEPNIVPGAMDKTLASPEVICIKSEYNGDTQTRMLNTKIVWSLFTRIIT